MPRSPKAKAAPKDSSANRGFGMRGCKSAGASQRPRGNPTFRSFAIMNPALGGIEAESGPPAIAGPDTFRRDLHPALRDADYVLTTDMRDSALLNAKPRRRACQGNARSGKNSSRPTLWTAWSPSPASFSTARRFPSASGSSRKTNTTANTATAAHTLSSKTPANSALAHCPQNKC